MGRMSKPPYQQRSHHLKLKQVYLLKVLPCCLCKVWMNLISFVVFPNVFLSLRQPCSSVSALLFVSMLVFRTFIVFVFLFCFDIFYFFVCLTVFSLPWSVIRPSVCPPLLLMFPGCSLCFPLLFYCFVFFTLFVLKLTCWCLNLLHT